MPLNPYEQAYLESARNLPLNDPPVPWKRDFVISAAGVFACGWQDHQFILLSHDGYSVTDVTTQKRLIEHFDPQLTYANLSSDELRFTIPETQQTIDIFGVRAGDGIHFTQDQWFLEPMYPWWPRCVITLRQPSDDYRDRWHNVYAIRLDHLEDSNIKCGFSPSGKYFVIMGHAGAEIFSR